jgi:hypothetical protein
MQFNGEAGSTKRPVPPAVFAIKPCPEFLAVTHRGREIPLFQYEVLALRVNGQQYALNTKAERREFAAIAESRFLRNTVPDATQVVRLIETNPRANCHGWVFLEGRFGIESSYVPSILEDQGFFVVQEPRAGDLVTFEARGELIHSGIVGERDRAGRVLIESKWGPFGVYLHGPAAQPFPGACTFYRSERLSRGLTIRQA